MLRGVNSVIEFLILDKKLKITLTREHYQRKRFDTEGSELSDSDLMVFIL
jgi:hypothetical protein